MLIWQKHILKKISFTFLFFLLCLFGVYVLVDLSAHGVRFFSKTGIKDLSIYYLLSFSVLFDLFLTLSFLLSTMRVLYDLNAHREVLALQMASISKKKLLTPFFVFAGVLSLICYANTQWIFPIAQDQVNSFKQAYKSKKPKVEVPGIYTVSLEDESEIVYQRYNPKNKELFDVFWIRSPADLWHMKSLNIDSLEAKSVDHFIRKDRMLEKLESFEEKHFREIVWNRDAVLDRFVPFEYRPITTLILQAFTDPSEKKVVFTHLYYKLLVPLMPFVVLFAVSPYSLRFSRNMPFFLYVAYAIFGFVALKIVLDGMLILGENLVVPAFLAIWGPLILSLLFCVPNFVRMR